MSKSITLVKSIIFKYGELLFKLRKSGDIYWGSSTSSQGSVIIDDFLWKAYKP